MKKLMLMFGFFALVGMTQSFAQLEPVELNTAKPISSADLATIQSIVGKDYTVQTNVNRNLKLRTLKQGASTIGGRGGQTATTNIFVTVGKVAKDLGREQLQQLNAILVKYQ